MIVDASAPPPALPAPRPIVKGWNAPRSGALEGPEIPMEQRDAAVALANVVAMAPRGTPLLISQLSANMGEERWPAVEQVIEIIESAGLAVTAGDGDAESVSFNPAPDPQYV